MFRYVEKMFIAALTLFSCGELKCILMSNQECKVRPAIVNINGNEPYFILTVFL